MDQPDKTVVRKATIVTMAWQGLMTVLVSIFFLTSCHSDSPPPAQVIASENTSLRFIGAWQALVPFDGQELRLELELEFADQDDAAKGVTGRMHIADFGMLNLPLLTLDIDGQQISLSSAFALQLNGNLQADGHTIVAEFGIAGAPPSTVRLIRNNPAFQVFRVPRLAATGDAERRYRYTPPQQMDDGWLVGDLADHYIDIKGIETTLDSVLREEHGRIESLLIIRHGKLLLEEYFYGFTHDRLHSLQSTSKSITSLLFGIAKGQGLIASTDQQVWPLFPQYQGRHWIDEQYDITLWHLLTMSANIDWNELLPYTDPMNSNTNMNLSEDWIAYVLDRPIAGEPGKVSSYTSGLSILLGGVIHNVSGQHVDHFAEQTLFADLGIGNYRWFNAPDGTRHTGGGLNLVARDFAKTGQLVLSKGQWNGKQVVPADWISESTQLHLPVIGERQSRGMIGYGYQWWHMRFGIGDKTADAILASGYGGQMLAIFPQWDLLIVTNGGEYGYVERERPVFSYTHLLESGILQAVTDSEP